MKKGFSVFTLILALVVLVVLALILFAPGGLLTKSREKAFDIANKSLGEEKFSIPGEIAVEDYFGINIILPSDKQTALKILGKAVVDCYNMCKKEEEVLFCNYVDSSNVPEFFLGEFKKYAAGSDFNKDEQLDLGFAVMLVAGDCKKGNIPCHSKFEICCNEDYVFVRRLGQCMKKAEG